MLVSVWNTLHWKTAVIIRVSSSHSCSVSGPGYCLAHLWSSTGKADDNGCREVMGCAGKRGMSVHEVSTTPFNHLHLCAMCCHLCISSSITGVPAPHHCEFADSRNVLGSLPHFQTMEKGYPLCSKRCPHGRSFSHSWVQQLTSRLQGKKTASWRHTIQLNLIIKTEKKFGFCSSVEA